jgi:membrane dipeptidase
MFIVDAHLDLSYNALRGRDVLAPADKQPADDEGIPSVGLPDLRAGGVGLICATIFCLPVDEKHAGYRTADEARDVALHHLAWYRNQVSDGRMRLACRPNDLSANENAAQAAILLMEGADPLRSPREVDEWFAAGLRIVGLAWRKTLHAGGTATPGPLTPLGRQTIAAMDRHGMIHDLSHLAEESFWQLLDTTGGPVMASHSNCRAIVPTDRQLSDEMIRAVARRGGAIGINFFDKFLGPPAEHGKRRATLGDVVTHVKHMCDLIGDARHVGLGTDMDGGLGREQIPVEIRTSADLPKVADALSQSGFSDRDVSGILGNNWVEFFRRTLPVTATVR